MDNSPAEIIAACLISKGVFNTPSKTSTFPLFVSHLPSAKDVMQAAAISDIEGLTEMRFMSGVLVVHPGLQIRVRSSDYNTAFKKMELISSSLSSVIKEEVAIGDTAIYIIHNVSQTSSIISMGIEPDTRLYLFSINFITTITQKEV